MSFLCSNLTDVRKVALDVLFTIRELHGKLLQAGGRSAPVTPVTPAPSITNPPTPGEYSLQAITPCHHTITYIWQVTLSNAAFDRIVAWCAQTMSHVSNMVDLQSSLSGFCQQQCCNPLQH